MKRQTQDRLYRLLPIAFWLLAIGGAVAGAILVQPDELWAYSLPSLLVVIAVTIVHRIERHASSVEQCFWLGMLLTADAYMMPSVALLVMPIWGYLIYRNIFSFRSLLSTLVGAAVVLVWLAVMAQWADIPFRFPITKNLWAWLPTGLFLTAYIAATIVRQTLRVR